MKWNRRSCTIRNLRIDLTLWTSISLLIQLYELLVLSGRNGQIGVDMRLGHAPQAMTLINMFMHQLYN